MEFTLVDVNDGVEITSPGVRGLLVFRGGTVCDDDFNGRTADLICQSMGWKSASIFSSGYTYDVSVELLSPLEVRS